MKIVLPFIMLLSFTTSGLAANPTRTWLDLLQRCSPTQEIGKQSLFFGASNLIGPGSLWRFADDKSIRLVFALSDGFPNTSDQAAIVRGGAPHTCADNVSTKWALNLGLPFSTKATPLSADIASTLAKAKDVTVSVKEYVIDTLAEGVWTGRLKLANDTDYAKTVSQTSPGSLLLAENVVKVTKLKAIFNYSTDLSLDARASLKGKSFVLGNSTPGAGNMNGNSKAGSQNTTAPGKTDSPSGKSSPGASSAPSGNDGDMTKCDWETDGNAQATKATTANTGSQPGDQPETKPSTSSSSSQGNADNTSASSASKPSDDVATFHVGFNGKRQVIVCAQGPVYILGAYSKIRNSQPVGVAQSEEVRPPLLVRFDVPASAKVEDSERKASGR